MGNRFSYECNYYYRKGMAMRITDCEHCGYLCKDNDCYWCELACMHISDMTPQDCPDK